MSSDAPILLGFVVMSIGLLTYSIRTKTFFVFPGRKYAPAKWYEVTIAMFGFVIFMYFVLFGGA